MNRFFDSIRFDLFRQFDKTDACTLIATHTVKLLIQAGSQIEAGSLIQAGGFRSLVSIEAGSLIQAGSPIQTG